MTDTAAGAEAQVAEEAAAPETPETPHAPHHPTEKQYVVVALVLAAVTAVEVAVYYTAIPKHLMTGMFLVMSAIKFSVVVLWFMHLRFDSRVFRRLFVTGLLLAIGVFVIYLSTLHFYNPHRGG